MCFSGSEFDSRCVDLYEIAFHCRIFNRSACVPSYRPKVHMHAKLISAPPCWMKTKKLKLLTSYHQAVSSHMHRLYETDAVTVCDYRTVQPLPACNCMLNNKYVQLISATLHFSTSSPRHQVRTELLNSHEASSLQVLMEASWQNVQVKWSDECSMRHCWTISISLTEDQTILGLKWLFVSESYPWYLAKDYSK